MLPVLSCWILFNHPGIPFWPCFLFFSTSPFIPKLSKETSSSVLQEDHILTCSSTNIWVRNRSGLKANFTHLNTCSTLVQVSCRDAETSHYGLNIYYIIFNIKNICTLWKCGEIGTQGHCEWNCEKVQLLWKKVWQFIKKLKIELTFGPGIQILSLYQNVNREDRASNNWKQSLKEIFAHSCS